MEKEKKFPQKLLGFSSFMMMFYDVIVKLEKLGYGH